MSATSAEGVNKATIEEDARGTLTFCWEAMPMKSTASPEDKSHDVAMK